MNDITQYDEMQARFAAAYEYHKQTYTLKNPAPIRSKADGIDWKIIIGLLALVIFSIAVSGTRTVPEFGGGGSGWFAWGMLEVGAVILSYVLTKKFYDESKHKGVKRRLQAGSGLAVVVMLAANIHFEARVFGVELAAWLNLVIVILLSTSAPLLVWIAGEALGMEVVTAERRDLKADKEWKESLELWHEGLNRSWDAQKARLGVEIRVERLARSALPSDSNGIPLENWNGNRGGSSIGHSKNRNAREIVETYFNENAQAVQEDPMEIARLLQVGKSTVYAVRAERKQK